MANPKTIAIVDDDEAVRDALRFLLEIEGHESTAFASAADFLDAGPDRFACLILDHHMPVMTGLELVDRLRREHPGLPILLISGDLSPALAVRAVALGIDTMLAKALNDDDVLAFVHQVVDTR